MEVELTPEGLKGEGGILNLNKSRMRAVYFRYNEEGKWVGTTPLPADPFSQAYYFAKGFKAKLPEVSSNQGLICECGFEAKSDFGLQAHQRKHKKEGK